MKIRIRILVIFAALLATVAFYQPSAAQMPGFDMTGQVTEILAQVLPPYLGYVSMDPAEPATDEPVIVTASIASIPLTEEKGLDVTGAVLFFSTDDGDSWEQIDMEQEDNEELWSAEIPGQDAGTTVDFYVKAYNDVGDINIEAMGKDINIVVGESQMLELAGATNLYGYDPEDESNNPFEHLALIIEDEESETIPAADLRELRFGYDEENLYFRLRFSGKIDGGRLAPLEGRAYLGILLDMSLDIPDFDAADMPMRDFALEVLRRFPLDDIDTLIKKNAYRLAIWFWAPIADGIPIGNFPKEGLIKFAPENPKTPVFDEKAVESRIDEDGTVDLKISRESYSAGAEQLVFIFGVLQAEGELLKPSISLLDLSAPTVIKMKTHSYTVE